jgi:hypothetical protein
MNSGLNLSPVTYSTDGECTLKLLDSSRTEPMFVRKRWDDACRKVDLEVVPKKDKVLKASPGRGVWCGEYGEIGLRRWLKPVGNSKDGSTTYLCRNQI